MEYSLNINGLIDLAIQVREHHLISNDNQMIFSMNKYIQKMRIDQIMDIKIR